MHYEVELMRLWRQLLKKDVMAQTNFFAAGGNSLLAAKLAQDIEELTGVSVDLREIVAHPTPEALAARLGAISTGTGSSRESCLHRSAEPGANVARRVVPSAFADWGPALTCYTSALGVYLAADDDRWWRVLADGAPYLAISPAPAGLLRFEHHPCPPARLIGLRARGANDWTAAWAGLQNELDAAGRVIVAADARNVPWLTAYGRKHAPHWFVLAREDDGYVVDDPLDHVDDHGRQFPVRVHLDEDDVRRCCGALIDPSPHLVLREEAALGASESAFGAAYRWLVCGERVLDRPAAITRHGALELADNFERAAADPDSYRQADDIWQGLRQRELLIRVLEVEEKLEEIRGLPPREPWEHATELWRRLPPLLMHAQLLARAGARGESATTLVETLRAIAEAESQLASCRFPVAAMS
jgi:hypothetical protein